MELETFRIREIMKDAADAKRSAEAAKQIQGTHIGGVEAPPFVWRTPKQIDEAARAAMQAEYRYRQSPKGRLRECLGVVRQGRVKGSDASDVVVLMARRDTLLDQAMACASRGLESPAERLTAWDRLGELAALGYDINAAIIALHDIETGWAPNAASREEGEG